MWRDPFMSRWWPISQPHLFYPFTVGSFDMSAGCSWLFSPFLLKSSMALFNLVESSDKSPQCSLWFYTTVSRGKDCCSSPCSSVWSNPIVHRNRYISRRRRISRNRNIFLHTCALYTLDNSYCHPRKIVPAQSGSKGSTECVPILWEIMPTNFAIRFLSIFRMVTVR